jgi:hypothetical protein
MRYRFAIVVGVNASVSTRAHTPRRSSSGRRPHALSRSSLARPSRHRSSSWRFRDARVGRCHQQSRRLEVSASELSAAEVSWSASSSSTATPGSVSAPRATSSPDSLRQLRYRFAWTLIPRHGKDPTTTVGRIRPHTTDHVRRGGTLDCCSALEGCPGCYTCCYLRPTSTTQGPFRISPDTTPDLRFHNVGLTGFEPATVADHPEPPRTRNNGGQNGGRETPGAPARMRVPDLRVARR